MRLFEELRSSGGASPNTDFFFLQGLKGYLARAAAIAASASGAITA
jgi:hypothetical protein